MCKGFCSSKLKQAPWSKVFSGRLGKAAVAFLGVAGIMAISMLIAGYVYINLVSNVANSVCSPEVVRSWFPISCTIWILLILFIAFICNTLMLFDKETLFFDRHTSRWELFIYCCSVLGCFFGLCLFLPFWTIPLGNLNGLLIKSDNGTEMYQYMDGLTYLVVPTTDGNVTKDPNMTCDSIPVQKLCPYSSSLTRPPLNNITYLVKCQPDSKEGLELVSTYINPIRVYSIDPDNLKISALFFYVLGCTIMICRRLSCLYESEAIELGERTPLI